MKRWNRLALWALPLVLSVSGCFRMTIYQPVDQPEEELPKLFIDFDRPHNAWHHSVLIGMIDLGPVNVKDKCPGGVAKVHTRTSFFNLLATALTFSLYAPQDVQVLCAEAGTQPSPAGASSGKAGQKPADQSPAGDAAEE